MRYSIEREKIIKIQAGFHNSFFLTDKNNIYCHGLNNHGQCGHSNIFKDDHVV